MDVLRASLIGVLLLSAAAHAEDISYINLPTKDLRYDPVSQRIYASVPSRGGSLGNSIVPIDPVTGALESPIFVGSEPGKIAISDDGQALYVVLDGATSVRRVNLPARSADLQFGTGYVEDIAVMPGNPATVAISRRAPSTSPRHLGVAIFDNGVQRPITTPGHTGSNVIEFGPVGTTLYGYNNETSEFGFRKMAITPAGVAVTSVTANLLYGYSLDIAFDGGRIYATSGRVIDPEAGILLGTLTESSSHPWSSRTGRPIACILLRAAEAW